MKPIIQRGLDALEARIRALEEAMSRVLATLTVQSRGRFLAERVLSGSGSYAPTPGTRTLQVRMVGGGGGGGGGVEGVGVGLGGGGGSGAYIEFTLTGGDVGEATYSCGEGGSAGLVGGFDGGTGGDTTLTIKGTTYVAKGGTGGDTTVNSTNHLAPTGGHPQPGSTSGSFVTATAGSSGGHGFYDSDGSVFFSGAGGSNPLGGGGWAVNAPSRGQDGTGAGSGGSGANVTVAPQRGGVGAAGRIVVREFT